MQTLKKFLEGLKNSIESALDAGDAFKANEINANILLGTVILIMEICSAVCLILNEVGVFTADITNMRGTIIAVLLIETPIMILNSHYNGDKPWLKGLLCWGLIAICGLLTSTLGHNVSFVIVIPIIASLRYCDAKLTRTVAIASILVMALATLGNAFFGIVNLNVYRVTSPETVTIVGRIRDALDFSHLDNWNYFKTSVINDLIPKYIIFSVIGFTCVKISQRGRDLTDMQDKITKKTQRLETELNLATEIQASMLPCIFPAFPEHSELDLFAINFPAKEVGGDFYDYFIIDPTHIAVVMADVSGKGVGAALFMTISKIVLKNQLMSTMDPAIALMNTNKQLCENNDAELFVTVWAGIYNTVTGVMTFANAGHNPPIIIRQNESPSYLVTKAGFVLAGLENYKYSNCTINLKQGDELILYTDGVTEANDINNNLYGEDRLIKYVETQRVKSSMDQVNNLINELYNYMNGAEQFDDITIMAMKVKTKE